MNLLSPLAPIVSFPAKAIVSSPLDFDGPPSNVGRARQ